MSNHYGTSRSIKRELAIYGFARPRAKFANKNAKALLGQVTDSWPSLPTQGHLESIKTEKISFWFSFPLMFSFSFFHFCFHFRFWFCCSFIFRIVLIFFSSFSVAIFKFYCNISRPPRHSNYSMIVTNSVCDIVFTFL